ncbi:Cell division control protein 3 [Smittium mucronatum]|uniref:Cell division control protein 3 n=1 Tax=Smittium mucronatum TaxID=133383 RepID=A0A1R0H4N5_9FUNG|nr:Cell division control protein 3 [Smittium mucronatum]
MDSTKLGAGSKAKLQTHVGLSSYPKQVYEHSLKTGFKFNMMVVGESGLGKATLINSLFDTKIFAENEDSNIVIPSKNVDINTMSTELLDSGVKLRLNVIESAGFGDNINNEDCWKPVVENIESRFDSYLTQENKMPKSKIVDNRVHALIYFIKPTGHSLRAIDINFMKKVHSKVNLIPVVAKADMLTQDDIAGFKQRIMADIQMHGINIFKPTWDSSDSSDMVIETKELVSKIPFAVVGSDSFMVDANGIKRRVRVYPWGIVEVENSAHNDFISFRNMLVKSNMEELKFLTDVSLYEAYRTQKLLSMGHVQDNSVFREFNPSVLYEEERRLQEIKMQKMEAEMNAVFMQKIQEKESKLKQSEEELYARHKDMKLSLEKQRNELEERKKKMETVARPITPMEKKTKKGLFNLS